MSEQTVTPLSLTIAGAAFPAKASKLTKGKGKGRPVVVLDPPTTPEALSLLVRAVGKNFYETVFRHVIRDACLEASEEAFLKDEAGNVQLDDAGNPRFDPEVFAEAFVDSFTPSERRKGGPTRKELAAQHAELLEENRQLLSDVIAANANGTWNKDHPAYMAFADFQVKSQKLAEAIAAKDMASANRKKAKTA